MRVAGRARTSESGRWIASNAGSRMASRSIRATAADRRLHRRPGRRLPLGWSNSLPPRPRSGRRILRADRPSMPRLCPPAARTSRRRRPFGHRPASPGPGGRSASVEHGVHHHHVGVEHDVLGDGDSSAADHPPCRPTRRSRSSNWRPTSPRPLPRWGRRLAVVGHEQAIEIARRAKTWTRHQGPDPDAARATPQRRPPRRRGRHLRRPEARRTASATATTSVFTHRSPATSPSPPRSTISVLAAPTRSAVASTSPPISRTSRGRCSLWGIVTPQPWKSSRRWSISSPTVALNDSHPAAVEAERRPRRNRSW